LTWRYRAAAFCARSAAHRFLAASAMRFRPAALNRRFLAGASLAFFCSAQRALCAAAILRRPAALITRRLSAGAGSLADPSWLRISAIFAAI